VVGEVVLEVGGESVEVSVTVGEDVDADSCLTQHNLRILLSHLIGFLERTKQGFVDLV
jgi:hypothetical protein